MTWGAVFDRAERYDVSVAEIRETLAGRRDARDADHGGEGQPTDDSVEPGPERVVADADVLAADVVVGGASRAALDHVRSHSWVRLVASAGLLDDAQNVLSTVADGDLAADWRTTVETEAESVAVPPGDHPALASAYRGGAMHVLTFDEGLRTAGAGVAIRARVETSAKDPAAFARLFDPEALYPAVADGAYPGPDRDPRH